MTIVSEQFIPARIWNKIRLAGKLSEFIYTVEHHDSRYQVNLIQFCAQFGIKLTAPDLKEIRTAYWKVNKPVAGLTEVPRVKSRFDSQLYRGAWSDLHGVRKYRRKAPLLVERPFSEAEIKNLRDRVEKSIQEVEKNEP